MTDPNAMTCHWCGVVKPEGRKPSDPTWWHFNDYRGYFTGLACPSCSDWIYAQTIHDIEERKTADAVAKEIAK